VVVVVVVVVVAVVVVVLLAPLEQLVLSLADRLQQSPPPRLAQGQG